jgi:dipeptidyl aminopeptidase/acylaminoacyl peptidase
VWTPGSQLVVRASPEQSATGPARADWWRVDGDAAPCNLTALLPRSPGALVTARGIDRLFAAVEGAMWSIDPADSSVRSLCKLEGHSVSPLPAGRTPQQTTLLVSAYSVAGRPSVEWLTMSAAADAAEAVRIVFPTATSTMIPGDPRCGALAFRDDTAAGTAIWTTDGTGQHAVKRRELNAHVAEIAEGERSLVAYRSTDGAELQAAVILPPGHVAGTRHPVVAWVYGGMIVRDKNLAIASKSSTRPLNLELLAGHGYAVVVPSVPLPAAGANGDPMTAICKSVLPCIDRIVEIGIGDPQRLAVMGHSTGGYTTYAVVTQTDRFRAAIALSGHPDLVSLHTQLFPAERTNGRAHEGLATAMFTEDEPLFLGGPPWADMARYVRNSPLTYLDRVTTPLLIVHGDMDGAPIQQGEQAFVGLYRLGKRARFVRYWGEGHVIGSAANVRHLWAQIFEWLDTNLAVPPLQQPR